MIALELPQATVDKIIDNPSILGARFTGGASMLEALDVSTDTAELILDGYIQGFKIVFVTNAILGLERLQLAWLS